jgi:uncharacterized protein with HEPN domain
MKQATDRIVRYTEKRTFEDYLSDDFLRSAVERQFEIVGEAMTRLRQTSPELAAHFTSQNKISGFRNSLIHGYDTVDHRITWNIILVHLPILRKELESLLA